MNITKKWRRVMAVGCSHGNRANPKALDAVLRFKRRYKPDAVIHLGDAYDLASLRAGAMGNSNDSDSVDDYMADIDAGAKFIGQLEPTVLCVGNHDERAAKFRGHHNAVIRGYAAMLWDKMLAPARKCKAKVIEQYTVLPAGWYTLGGYKWGHGHLYAGNFLRDTATAWGNTVVAHAHRAGMAKGRRSDNPTCFSPGTLADIPAMEYALRRAATLEWSHGIVWGEYTDDRAQLMVTEWPQGETEWRLPV